MPNEQIGKILEKYPGARRDKLIPILQDIQDTFGYLDEENIKIVGKYLKLPTSKIYGIATFYNQFSFTPRGKNHIRLCHGTSCHIHGAAQLISETEKILRIKHGETSKDGVFSLEVSSCLGACSRAPVMEINDRFYSRTDSPALKGILDSMKKKS